MAEYDLSRVIDVDLAYLAGLMDGEGTICLFHSGMRVRPIVSIYNSDFAVLEWVASTFGGRANAVCRDVPGWKQGYAWTTGWQHGKAVLIAIFPYLKIKRQQAELFISYCNTKVPNRKRGVSEELQAIRAGMVSKMAAMNRKGRSNASELS